MQVAPTVLGPGTRRATRFLQAISVAALIAYGIFLVVHDSAAGPVFLFDRIGYCALLVIPGVLCVLRATLVRRERLAWLLVGLSVLLWAAAEVYWAIAGATPDPSLSDAFALPAYPVAFAAIVLLIRARARRFRNITLVDGLVAALTVTAFGTAFLLPEVIAVLEGPWLADAVTLAYPIADTLQLGFLASLLVLLGWRLDASWALLFASLAILPIADGIYSYQQAMGTYSEGGAVDFLFPMSAVLVGLAAWQPSRRSRALTVRGWRSIAAPAVFAAASGALVVWGYFGNLDELAVPFAAVAMLLAITRLAATYRDNQRLFEQSQTDPLTGLANRSALILDLDEAIAEHGAGGGPVLVMLDLNGFKLYNDTFGHPAGDALLSRVARRLGDVASERGRAYRIGGDEFCVLLDCPPSELQQAVSRIIAALTERGEGFEISAAKGTVRLGEEANEVQQALQLADRRMYSDKSSTRSSARGQAHEVLLRVLRERQPDLGVHVDRVSELAVGVARRIGIEGEELDVVARAAALHDIGKLAVPDAVLAKPAPLDPEEWRFIRDHTMIGERILREAPALDPVAELVRSSHERWDGGGYPDRLTGEEIPLGSRVIFVCDAFQAMTSDRPYAPGVSTGEAIAELRRCAGSQFDPRVVEAFCAHIAAADGPAQATAPVLGAVD